MVKLTRLNEINFGKELDDSSISAEKTTPYQAMEYLSKKAENSGLDEKFWNDPNVITTIDIIHQIMPLTDMQIILISVLGAYTLGNGSTTLQTLGRKMDVSPYKIFEVKNEIDELIVNSLVECTTNPFSNDVAYSVNMKLLKNLRDNKKNVIPEMPKLNDNLEFVKYIYSIIKKYQGDIKILETATNPIYENNYNLDIVKNIDEHGFNNFERCVIIILIDQYICKKDEMCISDICRVMSGASQTDMMYELRQNILSPDKLLMKLKYVEIEDCSFASDNNIHITMKAIRELMPKEYKKVLALENRQNPTIEGCTQIKPQQTTTKTLIYDDKTKQQVDMLYDILSDKGLRNLQTNLKKQGLRTGINVLLYGYPGTGKTETVLQLCKKCHRIVLQVNISDMKSKWFGQSEKIVNNMFDTYEKLSKGSSNMPVLLFNEADGVLSKRKSIERGNGCTQSENAIQNIILQHFENSNGIIICTTNMTANLDDAFNRRFLYKIEFSKPDIRTKTALVNLKLGKYLTDDQCRQLATNYQVTGGMLDNILTKIIARQCLYNTQPTYPDIDFYCRQDIIGSAITPIGF